jgi:hypothetical protein
MREKKAGLGRYAPVAARVLLGLTFFVLGLNGFLRFIPQPPPPEAAGAFVGALIKSGYLFQLLKGTEVLAGALLLSNRFVPLALTVLSPIVVNIFMFHAVLAPSGVALAGVIVLLLAYLGYAYRAAFRPMLASKVEPSGAEGRLGADVDGVAGERARA